MSNPAEDDYKAEAKIVYGVVVGKGKQDHDAGIWLNLKRFDTIVKYLEFATLVTALVFDRLGTLDWFEEKYFWWMTGGALGLNFFMQSVHMFLYYVANRYAKDKYYWPRVYPTEWIPDSYGSGYSQHYKFFYFLKALLLAYIGFMVFQEKLDGFFMYWTYGLTLLLLIFDLCFYLFGLK